MRALQREHHVLLHIGVGSEIVRLSPIVLQPALHDAVGIEDVRRVVTLLDSDSRPDVVAQPKPQAFWNSKRAARIDPQLIYVRARDTPRQAVDLSPETVPR